MYGRATSGEPLNEGRGVNPGDTRRTPACRAHPASSLNEGRGVNPGDTDRPMRRSGALFEPRSTKAGA